MSIRELPPRPHLDHLKREARDLLRAFQRGDSSAIERVAATIGVKTQFRLTEAQRVVAREHGFPNWARLRSHVLAARGLDEAVNAFLAAIEAQDGRRALDVLRADPAIAGSSIHVAAVLGRESAVRDIIDRDSGAVRSRTGRWQGEPLLWLCYSPFHGESAERDAALAATTRLLLDAGADPSTRDAVYGVPALYAVTGVNNAPRIARMLLEAGAAPNDGESLFHAAERFHVECLELLLEYGADLNATGDWGNTPLYFLIRYRDVANTPGVRPGVEWLLAHGADPNVRCSRERRENALHVAARQGQHAGIVELLLEHGADVHARDGDGRTAWVLAKRGGFDELAALLENAGAPPEPLSPADSLLAACGRGDAAAARNLTSPDLLATLTPADLRMLPEAAAGGRFAAVAAYVEAGFPIDTADEAGATALHHAAIRGNAPVARLLLQHGADFRRLDGEHRSTPLGWACFGADFVNDAVGDYPATVAALLDAGARLTPSDRAPEHTGVRAVLARYGSTGA